jgi:O-antigen/teichoic acid export membrane protein
VNAAPGRREPEPTWTVIAEQAGGDRPRYRLGRAVHRHLDLLRNSGSLMASTVVTSVFGFAYWWLAARSFPAEAVGSASTAVSAMMLIGTLGMFGMGTLLIAELPRAPAGQAGNFIAACLLVAGGAATVGGLLYAVIVQATGGGLRDALGSPFWTAVLVFAIAVNAMTLVLDEALVGMLAGGLQLLRNTYFSAGKLLSLATLAFSGFAVTGGEILTTWVVGILASWLLLVPPLRRRLPSLRPRPSLLRGLYRDALDHNLLNVALFLPRTALPLVVTAVLSTTATAGFYTAWMVFTFLAMLPGTLATTLFAVTATGGAGTDGAGAAVLLRSKMRMALFVSVAAGVPASLLLSVLARPVMSVFGREYAEVAAGALAILALSYLPTAVRQLYVAVARVRGFVRAATALAVAGGAAELVAAWYGGSRGGLTGLAAGYAAVVAAEALVMAPVVLRVALGRVRPARTAPPLRTEPEGAW